MFHFRNIAGWQKDELYLKKKVVSLDRVWNLLFPHKIRPLDVKKIFEYTRKQPVLVWTNSAQMMQPYLP